LLFAYDNKRHGRRYQKGHNGQHDLIHSNLLIFRRETSVSRCIIRIWAVFDNQRAFRAGAGVLD
jgi:hypothetical protein